MRSFRGLTLVAVLAWASCAPPGAAQGVAGRVLAAADSTGAPTPSPGSAEAPDTSLATSTANAGASETSLATSTAPPWNPPAPVAASETWETVVRTPGIILSLPFVGLGWVAKSSLSYVENNNLLPHVAAVVRYQGKIGLSV